MKKKILTILEVLLLLILIKLFATFVINELFIRNYNKEKYNINNLKVLSLANFPESYILYYNQGNVLYKNGKYKEAITEYTEALEKKPPEKKECSIRINLALAKLHDLTNDNSEENVKKDIQILKSARNVLCEKNCAGESDNNGHSEEAEKLKNDIDKRLKELEDKQNGGDDGEEEEKEENSDKNTQSKKQKSKTEKAEEELKKIQEESLNARQEELKASERLWGESMEYFMYSGKRW